MVRLLETYEEARLLLEAKGWGIAKAAEHLRHVPELARFHLNPSKLSEISRAGANRRIEPEVAAAVVGMQTWHGYERQTEIVTRGLLALHGDPPSEEMEHLAAELRERLTASEHALKLVEALEEKAGQRLTSLGQKLAERSASELSPKLVELAETLAPKVVEAVESLTPKMVEAVEALEEKSGRRAASFSQELAEKLGRVSRKQIAISAGSGALVALLLVPLLAAAHVFPTGPRSVIVPAIALDDSPVLLRFDPGSLFPTPARWGEKPLDQAVPKSTLPGQKVAPCDTGLAEVAINGNCWIRTDAKPPCGRLFRHEDSCYRPIAAEPKKSAP